MSTNITIDVLAREFDEANEKFKALSISDFGNHVDKQKMMQELQKVKFVAEAALENCKSSDFNDNNDSSAEHEENIIITLNALELYLEKLNVVNNFVSSEMGEVSSDDFNDEEQSRKIYEDRITEEEDVETVEDPEPQFDDNKETKADVDTEEEKSMSQSKQIVDLQRQLREKDIYIRQLESEANDRANLLDACSDEIQRLISKYEELIDENKNMRETLASFANGNVEINKIASPQVATKVEEKRDIRSKFATKKIVKTDLNIEPVRATSKKTPRGNFMRFTSPSHSNKERNLRSYHQTPKYRQMVRQERSGSKWSVQKQKEIATKTVQGHFSYVLPGSEGTDTKNPVVQYNRKRKKIDFDLSRRQSIVAPHELVQGRKNLKPLYLRPEKKFVSDELVQAKRCLSPTGAKTAKKSNSKKNKRQMKIIASANAVGDTLEWLEKSGAKISQDHRRKLRGLGIPVSSKKESRRVQKAKTSPVRKLMASKNKIKVRGTKSSRLRRQSILASNAKKDADATSWQKSHVRGR